MSALGDGAGEPDYLGAADAMLTGAGPAGVSAVDGGWWPRACACLIRLGLESGLNSFWAGTNAAVGASRNQRTKLVMLRRHVDRDVARRVAYAWATLSRLTHHRSFDAPPTASEMRQLHREVTDLLVWLQPSPTEHTRRIFPLGPNQRM
jgi:hypothetical protein